MSLKYSIGEIDKAVDWVLDKQKRHIAFKGDLGAGKTTLIKAICQKLGVSENMSSPSFSLVNEYESNLGPVFHFDFYRLKSPEEALDFGIEEYFYSGDFCLMEWPEMLGEFLPTDSLVICFEKTAEDERCISLC